MAVSVLPNQYTPTAVLASRPTVREDLRDMGMTRWEAATSMSVRVAVSDPLPMFLRGVTACLDDMQVETAAPTDLFAWASRPDSRVILLTVSAAPDWKLLADLCKASDDVAVVALLDQPDMAGYLRAVSAGAAGVMPRAGSSAEFRAVFQAALDGKTLLPTEVLRALTDQRMGNPDADEQPTAREIGWLQDLAEGTSVARIAEHAGYSERMMFRLLRELYAKLGGHNRTEAMLIARERRWI